jgi:hypothetical protein
MTASLPNKKIVAIVTSVIGTVIVALSVWIFAPPFAADHARQLITLAGKTADVNRQELYLSMARRLNANNQTAITGLDRLKVRQLIEQGSTAAAVTAADELLVHSSTESDRLLAGFAYILAGNTARIDDTEARLAHSQTLQRLQRAKSGTLPLALEMAAIGLQNSSERLLIKLPDSFLRDIALGDIYAGRASYRQAKTSYTAAAALNPADIPVRQKLASALRRLNQDSATAAQDQLIAKLRAGRP